MSSILHNFYYILRHFIDPFVPVSHASLYGRKGLSEQINNPHLVKLQLKTLTLHQISSEERIAQIMDISTR